MNTTRCHISPIQESDIEEILEMYFEPDSFLYIKPLQNKSKDFYTDFLRGKIEKNKPNFWDEFWTVRLKETQELVGTVNLNNYANTDITHCGCHLKTTFWHQGFASELLETVIDYGFSVRELSEIYGLVVRYNLISAKLMKKFNFKLNHSKEIENEILDFYKLSNPHIK